MAQTSSGSAHGLWTPANVVTCVRIAFIPVFMVVALLAHDASGVVAAPLAVTAFTVYVALSLTDKLDGHLARSRNEVTDFGKFLDPIADKLLVFSALLLLLQQGLVGVWAVFLILVREFLVSALRMLAASKGMVIAAANMGKAKTAVTMVSLCAYYLALALGALGLGLPGDVVLTVARVLMVVAVALTVASGAQYFWNARSVIAGGE